MRAISTEPLTYVPERRELLGEASAYGPPGTLPWVRAPTGGQALFVDSHRTGSRTLWVVAEVLRDPSRWGLRSSRSACTTSAWSSSTTEGQSLRSLQ